MDKIGIIFLLLLVIPITISLAYADYPIALNIPPTNAFDKIRTSSGTVSAVNYSMPLTITGQNGVSVMANNGTHTITLIGTSKTGGTYNTTQANNVNINTGGFQINFINGSGSTVNVQNSHSSNQVNVTISSTGSGGTITNVQGTTGNVTSNCVGGVCTINLSFNVPLLNSLNKGQTFYGPNTFTPNATRSGINIGSQSTIPSNFKNGDLFLRTTDFNLYTAVGGFTLVIPHLTGTNTWSGNQNEKDGTGFAVQASADRTKQLNFDISPVTTAHTITNKVFNTNGTFTVTTMLNFTSDSSAISGFSHGCLWYDNTVNNTMRLICNTDGKGTVQVKVR